MPFPKVSLLEICHSFDATLAVLMCGGGSCYMKLELPRQGYVSVTMIGGVNPPFSTTSEVCNRWRMRCKIEVESRSKLLFTTCLSVEMMTSSGLMLLAHLHQHC